MSKLKLIADPDVVYEGDSAIVHLRDAAGNAINSTAGALSVNFTNTTIAVTATNLDIRDLAFATDKVDVSGSSVTVSATNLDVRDLTHVSDSVKIGDGTDFLAVNADGSINVTGTFSIGGQYAEDVAHASSDVGLYNLAVRADIPAVSTSASGDYASQTVDTHNRGWVNTSANISMTHGANQIVNVAELLVVASAGRRRILIQNLQNREVYLGGATVTTANGIRLPAGANVELEIGPDLPIFAVAAVPTVTGDVRFLQMA